MALTVNIMRLSCVFAVAFSRRVSCRRVLILYFPCGVSVILKTNSGHPECSQFDEGLSSRAIASLFLKVVVLRIAAANEVGGQVEDLIFRHSIEQAGRHR